MEQAVALAADHRQYLTFRLDSEEYGVDILRVQEIRGYTAPTPIPNMPGHIRGVMNLRGAVIPVLDLRAKFGLPGHEYNKFSVIIVANIGSRVTGLIVDAVSDVLNIASGEIRECPDFGVHVDTRFIGGVVSAGGRLAVLLELDRLLQAEELEHLGREDAGTEPAPKTIACRQ